MTYSYSKDCISEIMENLGTMIECAVYKMEYDAKQFLDLFIISGLAKEIENRNPKFTVGMSGAELVQEILNKTFGMYRDMDDYYSLDKSPEYWAMWSLVYYQYISEMSFEKLLEVVDFDIILALYPTLHEADITKFVEVMDEKIEFYYNHTETSLARLRRLQGYSQRLLAEESGVSLRMIQLYEQKQNDINKAQAETLLRLGRVLGCGIEELMDYTTINKFEDNKLQWYVLESEELL